MTPSIFQLLFSLGIPLILSTISSIIPSEINEELKIKLFKSSLDTSIIILRWINRIILDPNQNLKTLNKFSITPRLISWESIKITGMLLQLKELRPLRQRNYFVNEKIGIFSLGRKLSRRCPNKMLRPFADTTLTDIVLKKLATFGENSFFAGYEGEFKEKCEDIGVRFVQRTKESVSIDEPQIKYLSFLLSIIANLL